MKTEQEITAIRQRLINAWAPYGKRHGHDFAGSVYTSEQVHFMAVGAMAFADLILELDRPANLDRLIVAIEEDNGQALAQPPERK